MAAAAPAMKRLAVDLKCGAETVETMHALGVPICTTAPGLGAQVCSFVSKLWSWCFCTSPWVSWLVGLGTLAVVGELILMLVRK